MKRRIITYILLALCLFLAGCGDASDEKDKMYIYYINADHNALIQAEYDEMDVEEALEKLKEHSVISDKLKLKDYKIKTARVDLYFDTDYFAMEKSLEVLSRAAIVQTLTQVEGVDFVSFYVGEDPLTDSDGIAVGLMRAEDFVQNTGSSIGTYQEIDLVLYFADKEGLSLKENEETSVRYNVNTTIERLVVEQLIKGDVASGSKPTIPKTTKILGVSVRDGICYVNFDSKFQTDSYNLNPEVAIYSVVNSIIKNGNVSQVQILIDGASDVTYKNSVDLSRPLEWNEELIKEQ